MFFCLSLEAQVGRGKSDCRGAQRQNQALKCAVDHGIYQNYSVMGRGSKKISPRCDCHQFSLKPLSDYTPHPQNLNLSFCTRHQQRRSRSSGPSSGCLQAPIFNKDKSHASPAFILPYDKDYYRARRTQMLEQHQNRFAQYDDQRSELLIPKPRSKNCYCNVCKQHYQDYLDHITSPLHRRRLSLSHIAKDIAQLVDKVSPTGPKKRHEILIRDSPIQTIDQSEQVQIISNPMKKIKTNQTVQLDTPPAVAVQNINDNTFPLPPLNQPWQSFQRVAEPVPTYTMGWEMEMFMRQWMWQNMAMRSMGYMGAMPQNMGGMTQNMGGMPQGMGYGHVMGNEGYNGMQGWNGAEVMIQK